MNFISLIGIAMSVIVLIYGLYSSTDNVKIFWDSPSALIVVGGTIAAVSIAFQLNRIGELIKVFLNRIIRGRYTEYSEIIKELMIMAEAYRNNPEKLNNLVQATTDPFLKDAMIMANEQYLEKDKLMKILRTRVDSQYQYYLSDANKFRTIGKFPPAFGMMGTTIGMIVLLSNLGGEDAMKMIGPAMSICLITTLYGCAIANLFIIPVAENLTASAKEAKVKNTIIVEGVRLIIERTNPIILAEELNSYLLPNDRLDWKKITSIA